MEHIPFWRLLRDMSGPLNLCTPNAEHSMRDTVTARCISPEAPINVIVSGSGRLDLERAVFRTPGVRTLIVTSPRGDEVLVRNGVAELDSVETRPVRAQDGKIAPGTILKLLRDEFAVGVLLHEGGPTLFGDFVAHNCVDELFLTIAPQVAGRAEKGRRPGLIAGFEFDPERAPWLKIISVKQSEDHLYLRYSLPGSEEGA